MPVVMILYNVPKVLLYHKRNPGGGFPSHFIQPPLAIFRGILFQDYNCQKKMQESCEKCKLKERQFKILEVELQFEVKKLNEDIAHQKLTLEMAHQREIKKFMEKIAFTKNERQLQTKSWMEKYDAMIRTYEEKLKKAQAEAERIIAQVKMHMSHKQQANSHESEAKLKKEITHVKQQTEDYKRKLLQTKEEQKKYLLKIHEEEICKLLEKHKTEIKAYEQEKQNLQANLQTYELAERNNQLVNMQFSEQIIQLKLEIENYKTKISTLENRIKHYLEPEIVKREKDIERIKRQHEKTCLKLKEDFKYEKERISKEMTKSIEQILEKEYQKCVQYERKLKELDSQREREIKLYQNSLEELKLASEERFIPKNQFHEELSSLKGRLTSKEKDIERAKEQIKQCKLQIENNEQILTKFFRTSNHLTAPDIFVHTPNKKKDYKIKKNRASLCGASFLDVANKNSNITSMECLDKMDKNKDFQSFRML